MDDDLQDWETYAKTRVPATYSDFIELAQQLMGHSQKEKLRQIINFKFKRHSRYNWSNERLGVVEKLLQKRVQFVLHMVRSSREIIAKTCSICVAYCIRLKN